MLTIPTLAQNLIKSTIFMDKNAETLKQLNGAILQYAVLRKQAVAEILVEKGKQLIFGSHSHGANFDGLYAEFEAKKPRPHKITADVSRIFKSGGGVLISPKSYAKADSILGGNAAGLFAINKKDGRAVLARQIIKGKRAGQHTARALKNSVGLVAGRTRTLALVRREGEVVLNRQALAANLELRKREGGRGYSAAAFLEKRYRRAIEKLAGRQYKRGQLKGVSSVDAVSMHKHVRELVSNRVGGPLSILEGEVGGKVNWLRLTVMTSNVNKAGFRLIAGKVMRAVTADIKAYIARKTRK